MEVRPAEAEDVTGIRAVAEAAWWEVYPGTLDTDTVHTALKDLYGEEFLRRVVEERDDVLFVVACESRSDSERASSEARSASGRSSGAGVEQRDDPRGERGAEAGTTEGSPRNDERAQPASQRSASGRSPREDGERNEPRAADDGEVVGFASAEQTWADEVEVHTLYVHPERWGEGVGTRLLESVEASAEAAGVDRLRTSVVSGNRVGRSFFEGRGFERVETVTAEVGDEQVPEDVFERPL